jgi:hypothetical protein
MLGFVHVRPSDKASQFLTAFSSQQLKGEKYFLQNSIHSLAKK